MDPLPVFTEGSIAYLTAGTLLPVHRIGDHYGAGGGAGAGAGGSSSSNDSGATSPAYRDGARGPTNPLTESAPITAGEAVIFAAFTSACICATIIGNILVILSVFTYRPLRNVANFFIVSLAVADLAVAILVMPFNVANFIIGHWVFGEIFCNMWLTFDVLTCTASILNLCAVAVDRYYAIHDPINYAQKRTILRVLVSIAIVWLVSAIISVPPIFGWNNSSGEIGLYDAGTSACQLTDERSYVIYSASGSFFIPLFIMTFVYVNVFRAVRHRLRERSEAARAAKLAAAVGRGGDHAAGDSTRLHDEHTLHHTEHSSSDTPDDPALSAAAAGTGTGTVRTETLVSSATNSAVVSDNNGTCMSLDHAGQIDPSSAVSTKKLIDSTQNLDEDVEEDHLKGGGAVVGVGGAGGGGGDSGAGACADSVGAGSGGSERSPLSGATHNAHNNSRLHPHERLNPGGSRTRSGGGGGGGRVGGSRGGKDHTVGRGQVQQFLEEKQRISLSKERRAARTMAIIMGVFVLCWLPFFLMYVIFAFCASCAETDPRVINFIVWLGYINSSLNPVIYTIFNIDFRRAFKKLLQGKWRTN